MDQSTAKAAAASNNADHVLVIPPGHPPPLHPRNNQQPETPKLSQNPEKPLPTSSPSRPPLPPAALRRRSSIAKPKSRFVEPPTPTHPHSAHPSPVHPAAAASLTATPTHRAAGGSTPAAEVDDDEDLFRNKDGSRAPASAARCRRRARLGVELCVLVLFLGLLLVSLVVAPLQGRVLWGLEVWKWCVMVITVFSGHLLSQWLVTLIVFVIERNFLLRTKVLYFVFGLKKSFQVCLWLALVLIAWSQLFDSEVGRSRKTARILNYVSRFLASMLIGSVIWLVKTFLMKVVASTFHRKAFFDRIQESVFHQYVLQTLSGPPLMELAENVGREGSGLGRVSISRAKEEKGVPEVIDVVKLRRMSQEKVSAWTMRGLITTIRSSRLSTISNTIESSFDDVDGIEQKDKEINSKWEAEDAAYAIFKNVARPGYKHIEEVDLLRFFTKEEVDLLIPTFEGAPETGKIKKSALKNWVVKAYLDRKSLAHSLNDTKTAVMQLHNLVSVIVIIISIIVTLLLMGIATTKVLVVVSSQLLVVVFIFGNACKTVFEALIFVFIMHPFDVGDRCVIDGTQMTVEEMNILTTVFLENDNEKIYYPNSVLSTKAISNFYRSPNMFDTIDFAIDISTSVESIGALRSKIKGYLESKPTHWHPVHTVNLKDILDVNKINMSLCVQHTMNFQNIREKNIRRSELVMELKKIFEEMSIRYHLLPQKVELTYVSSNPLPTHTR
ncbi:mechanosensitive ion channel protein 10 [Zea mays]|uniref:Mechanosensitive ion channel protein n=1 Tax=Zea mays TaxID=4577 RepID=A0A1D6NSI9_MAIZE|nr:mechanosensitive ion channel protein 10 [Zea mays]AQL01222.1 Mechanosensitive ion channel protein 10 [Zea mays]|eukprot:XP_008659143.1 mechanosensitive ion channel protein 10 [Zea mays]